MRCGNMKEIKILHLLPRLLSLYGEYGNVAVLQKSLQDAGFEATVTGWEQGDLDLTGFDFIYVGSGTEDNLLEAVKRLAPHAQAIAASIQDGQQWLATGNAMALFGKTITRKGVETEALGCFGYATEFNEQKRFLGDAVTTPLFGAPCIGFINNSCIYHGIDAPLTQLVLNPQLGNDKASDTDGLVSGNFRGTQLIGPVLVKNPHFLSTVMESLTGAPVTLDEDTNIVKAYKISVAELQARIQA